MSVAWAGMSANQTPPTATGLWNRFPDNLRIGFLLLSVIVVARLPIDGSLWLDEALTAWITRDSLEDTSARAVAFQGQSPLYFIMVWCIQTLFGSSEAVLRALSLAATVGSLRLLYVLGRRSGGESLGWLSCILLLSLDPVQVAAVSARPYALALFFSLTSVWALFRWEEDGRYRYSVLYLGCFLTSVYLQYLFVCMLAVHALHLLLFFRTQKVQLSSALSELCLVAATLAPAYLHMQELSQRRELLHFVPLPTWGALIEALFPPEILIPALLALILAYVTAVNRTVSWEKESSRNTIWVAFWAVFPPLLFYVLSSTVGISIFLERYFLFYTPAIALLTAGCLLIWSDTRTRAICVVGLIALLCIRQMDRRWMTEDWRGAARIVTEGGDTAPLVVYPGLAESRDLQWLQDEGKQEYLLSPLLYYQVRNPAAVLPPPNKYDTAQGKLYVDEVLHRLVNTEKRGYFVGLDQLTPHGSTVAEWVRRFDALGFKTSEVAVSRNSLVRVFEVSKRSEHIAAEPAASQHASTTLSQSP